MEDKNNNKDYKKLYKWDEEKPSAAFEEANEAEKKRSKKVLKRQAKEQERLRKKGILKERNKSRLTSKGKIWIIAAAAVVLIGAALWVVFGYFGWGIDLTRTLAKVDSMKVTEKEVSKYIEFLKNQDPASVPPENDPQYTVLRQNILDSIIVLKLLKRYGNANGYEITQQDIDAEYQKIVAGYPSEADLEKDIKDKKITKDFLREQIADQILRDRIFAKVTENMAVTEEEIKKYYDDNTTTLFSVPEQIRVSHILAKFNIPEGQELNDSIKNDAKSKILDIEDQLSEGKDFAELAKQYSEDTASAPNGGDIGFISKGQTVPEFEDAAFALEVGEVSPVIETYYGYHLIKVTEKQASYIKTYDEVKDSIQSYLLSNKQMQSWQDFVYSQINSSKIVYGTSLKGQLLDSQTTAESTAETAPETIE